APSDYVWFSYDIQLLVLEFWDAVAFYDPFTGTDGDPPDPLNWLDISSGSSYIEIWDNKLHQVLVSGTFTSAGVQLVPDVGDEDFDVIVDYDIATGPAVDFWSLQFTANDNNNTLATIIRGYYADVVTGHQYRTWEWDDGSGGYFGDILTSDVAGKLRITRVGTTWTTYYWNGSAWIQNHQFTQTTSLDNVTITIR
ncbi:unnamed protein product, partial [marine sediment metagenome]